MRVYVPEQKNTLKPKEFPVEYSHDFAIAPFLSDFKRIELSNSSKESPYVSSISFKMSFVEI